jgi:hypothetical protein
MASDERADHDPATADDVRDTLPSDLDAHGLVGPYRFPDNSRRRIPGAMYLVLAAGCLVAWLVRRDDDPVLVNDGFLLAAVILGAVGGFSVAAGWRLGIDEKGALERASAIVGWPIGHASAQLAWRGLRSRPTWRVLCYSTEAPPRRRGFVLIDAVDGREVDHMVEDNPEDWAGLAG